MRMLIILLALVVSGNSFAATPKKSNHTVGKASYYHHKFHGRKTANGEKFNNNAFTCAHRKHHFNTILQVTRLANGKMTYCRVNDRGPFSKGRIIDLSRRAAKDIGMIPAGITKVKVKVHCRPGKGASKYNVKTPLIKCVESPGDV